MAGSDSHHGVSLTSFARPPSPSNPPPPCPPLAPPPHALPPAPHPPIDDRRQHEPGRSPPVQEHRQPPHFPAHPSFPPYPPTGPMIKADPADDAFPQFRRPLPTGGSAPPDNITPVTPHSAVLLPPPPPHFQPYAEEQPPPMYSRQPSYQPQTRLPHPQPYDYASHGELPYSIQVAAATGKRKAQRASQRASQACDNCRQLKAKCDELKPCKSCKEKNIDCKYREAVPKEQDKIAANILGALVVLRSKFEAFEDRLGRIEHAMVRTRAPLDLRAEEAARDEDTRPDSAASGGPARDDGASTSPGDTAVPQEPMDSLEARAITRTIEEEKEVEPGPIVAPGAPSIPVNHTTLANFLLKWPPIEVLVRDILVAEGINYVDEFPIRQEERRGLLRVWGRGEGLDSGSRFDKTGRDALRDAGALEVVPDDVSDAGGAPSPADCWGGISGSPGPSDGRPVIGTQTPDFSESLVWKYVESFQDNIQNMHPLIIQRELNAMVKLFLDTIQQSMGRQFRGSAGIAKFAVTSMQVEVGSKRKRSPAPDGAELPSMSPKLAFPRSINNALVLLVLALGKICLHKDRIPDVVPVSEPSHGSPVTPHSHSVGLPSLRQGSESPGGSRRFSLQGGGSSLKGATSLKRNLDVIPGLDYFAYATDILGGQLAGTSLRHIHAHILAGLYYGQLGRVLESYAHIKEAGFALQIKLRPSLYRLRKVKDMMHVDQSASGDKPKLQLDKSENQLVFAFWTCMQLESDIIAELPVPQSHILAYEDLMPYPDIHMARQMEIDERVLKSYLAQLYLRKQLNSIHGMLYNPAVPLSLEETNVIESIQNSLDMRWVPPEFKFNHDDPPAADILSARLRAKYWGAQVITYRPFVGQILQFNFAKAHPDRSQMPPSSLGADIPVTSIGPKARSIKDISKHVIEYAARGVRALIESTRAFHGLKEKRFIVTNIFGTAHAQWGNLLTLSAVFRDPTLQGFVEEHLLRDLFARTISFFRVIAHPTSALHVDLRILEGLQRKLWGRSAALDGLDHPTDSSFSSHSPGGGSPPLVSPPSPVNAPDGHLERTTIKPLRVTSSNDWQP
ncbi:hypothetical protein VTK56DRAFT_4312 [Thermocarpiscus australiensis]